MTASAAEGYGADAGRRASDDFEVPSPESAPLRRPASPRTTPLAAARRTLGLASRLICSRRAKAGAGTPGQSAAATTEGAAAAVAVASAATACLAAEAEAEEASFSSAAAVVVVARTAAERIRAAPAKRETRMGSGTRGSTASSRARSAARVFCLSLLM
jgi:hypothetical protein